MEAVQRWSVSLAVLVCAGLLVDVDQLSAQNARTQNFLVHAPNQALAEAVARGAEKFRDDLAIYWLGRKLPAWSTPCPINVVAGPHLAAQGATTYNRDSGSNFQMEVVGTPERILDSVLPHEVTHTVLATHFGGPLPRWADEGICTTVEHSEERDKHEAKLREFLSTRRGIAMNDLFRLTEYPSDMLPMYAQGYSVCRFLVEQSGPRQFIAFLEDYMRSQSWTANVQAHYGYDSLAQLQENWLAWVARGSGPVDAFVSARSKAAVAVASNSNRTVPATPASLASATTILAAVTSLAAAPISPATAEKLVGGWYKGRRDQTAMGQIASMSNTASDSLGTPKESIQQPIRQPIGPPSVTGSGVYSVSQPQSEQRYGQATPMASSARSTPLYR